MFYLLYLVMWEAGENTQLCFYKKIRKGKTHSVDCCYWSGFVSLWRSIRLLNLCSITLYLSVHLDSHWWRTIQCAANSFSSGTSNRAGSNSSSRAVGLTLGSLSRHFWINSYKKTHKLVTRHWKKVFFKVRLYPICSFRIPTKIQYKHMLHLLQRVLQ